MSFFGNIHGHVLKNFSTMINGLSQEGETRIFPGAGKNERIVERILEIMSEVDGAKVSHFKELRSLPNAEIIEILEGELKSINKRATEMKKIQDVKSAISAIAQQSTTGKK